MAHPIKPTPVITGKDAETFLKDLECSVPDPKKEKFLRECRELYKQISKNK